MKHFSLVLIFIFFATSGYLQLISNVDFDKVKAEIKNESSAYFYSNLKNRLSSNDSTLTSKEYFYLYYGSVFQETYKPYGTSATKQHFLNAYNEKDYLKAIELGQVVLKENPVDLDLMLKLSISHLELGKQAEKRLYANHYFSFLSVIYESGSGGDLNTAFVVLSVGDEYALIGDMGLRPVQQHLIGDCDLLIFKPKDQPRIKGKKKVKALYFNVKMPLMSLSKTYKDADLPEAED
jgi:hypothetical protein